MGLQAMCGTQKSHWSVTPRDCCTPNRVLAWP